MVLELTDPQCWLLFKWECVESGNSLSARTGCFLALKGTICLSIYMNHLISTPWLSLYGVDATCNSSVSTTAACFLPQFKT